MKKPAEFCNVLRAYLANGLLGFQQEPLSIDERVVTFPITSVVRFSDPHRVAAGKKGAILICLDTETGAFSSTSKQVATNAIGVITVTAGEKDWVANTDTPFDSMTLETLPIERALSGQEKGIVRRAAVRMLVAQEPPSNG